MEQNYENQDHNSSIPAPDTKEVSQYSSSPDIKEGYNVDLSGHRRNKPTKRRFPLWIKIFSLIIILAATIFSLIKLTSVVSGTVAFNRGEKASKEKNYITAANEYKKAIEKHSDSTVVLAKLFVAQYYNLQIDEAFATFETISGRESDMELVDMVNSIIEKIETYYYPQDNSFYTTLLTYYDDVEILVEAITEYLEYYPDDVCATYYLADKKVELKRYDEAEQLMNDVLAKYDDFYFGHLLLAEIYCEKGDYDKSVEYCQKVLADNQQNTAALGNLVRAELKLGDVKKGMELATKTYELDKTNPLSVSNMALAYHYNNMTKERDEMFEQLKNGTYIDNYTINLLTSIFNGELEWRK
ncbi:tetratricopeptide repeat protein [Acetivibrio mesophilus]|uniref:Uncharacterized protein n=1 Tax=Acetivibrio mesophilus TaxID=2487273 RepID=A0A4Q0I6I0_9FIRM|nr:tetratricopeptide repeat protein [Acetivibrio mesophilus]ODM27475.1 hypothetical protein A7W90_15315 [Clostridium sp. Bc-iso-3]RXE59435.1 hypothetical protein EFD62_07205 [Acetivibrio mesophilus]HHV30223.1 hypothetical protein [Clostridium sp.]